MDFLLSTCMKPPLPCFLFDQFTTACIPAITPGHIDLAQGDLSSQFSLLSIPIQSKSKHLCLSEANINYKSKRCSQLGIAQFSPNSPGEYYVVWLALRFGCEIMDEDAAAGWRSILNSYWQVGGLHRGRRSTFHDII